MTDSHLDTLDSLPFTVREGVEVEPVICGKCGQVTVSRIESPDGKIGCLSCLKEFLTPRCITVLQDNENPELPKGQEIA